jgi:hypothetical protein
LTSSTRRFFARPSSVSLLATGATGPTPTPVSREAVRLRGGLLSSSPKGRVIARSFAVSTFAVAAEHENHGA